MITESEKDIFELEQIYNIMIHDMADQLTTDYHGQSWIINYYFQKAKQKLKGGKPVMKVMISQPMNGIPDSEVRKIQNELKEKFAKYHIEVVDSFLTEEADTNLRNQGVFYLGRTIQKFLSDVDAVYFVNGWEKARGCRIERNICNEYDIKILDESFFIQPIINTVGLLNERYFESITVIFDINRDRNWMPDIQIQRRFIPESEIENIKNI